MTWDAEGLGRVSSFFWACAVLIALFGVPPWVLERVALTPDAIEVRSPETLRLRLTRRAARWDSLREVAVRRDGGGNYFLRLYGKDPASPPEVIEIGGGLARAIQPDLMVLCPRRKLRFSGLDD